MELLFFFYFYNNSKLDLVFLQGNHNGQIYQEQVLKKMSLHPFKDHSLWSRHILSSFGDSFFYLLLFFLFSFVHFFSFFTSFWLSFYFFYFLFWYSFEYIPPLLSLVHLCFWVYNTSLVSFIHFFKSSFINQSIFFYDTIRIWFF